jgi:hypothetical protein
LPNRKPLIVYDPSFSSDRFGVQIDTLSGREEEARAILSSAGALEIREAK